MIEDCKCEQACAGEAEPLKASSYRIRRVANGWVLAETSYGREFGPGGYEGPEYVFPSRIELAEFIQQRFRP